MVLFLSLGPSAGSRFPLSLPEDVYGKGARQAGQRRAWTWGPSPLPAPAPAPPPPPPAAARAGRGLPRAAPLFSLPQLRLRKCCPRRARRGCRLQPPQRPIKMTTDTEAEGREGGREGAAEEPGWEQRHPHLLAPGAAPLKPPPPPTAGVRAGGELPALWAGRPRRGSSGGAAAPPPAGRPLPARQARTHLLRAALALSCAGRGEPSPPGAGRRLGAPGRRLSGRRAPSPAGRWLLGGCGGQGAAEGCVPTGATRSGEPSAPAGATFSPLSPRPGGLRRSLPAGPVSGLSAEDPPPGAALRLLRRRRMRRRPPPGLPPAPAAPGDPRNRPCGRSARRRGKRTVVVSPLPSRPHPTPAPSAG